MGSLEQDALKYHGIYERALHAGNRAEASQALEALTAILDRYFAALAWRNASVEYLDAHDDYLKAKAANNAPAAAAAHEKGSQRTRRSAQLVPTQAAQELPPATEPEVGSTVTVAPAEGVVMVQLPDESGFVPLVAGSSVPVGSTVDARFGKVEITTATGAGETQSAVFHGSKFVVKQRDAALTELVLKGELDCSTRARGSAVQSRARGATRRRLWGDGHGRFRTRGSHGIATVRGTHWLTEDRCDGTLVEVRRGVVDVRDLVKRRTVTVRAGQRYLAKAKRR